MLTAAGPARDRFDAYLADFAAAGSPDNATLLLELLALSRRVSAVGAALRTFDHECRKVLSELLGQAATHTGRDVSEIDTVGRALTSTIYGVVAAWLLSPQPQPDELLARLREATSPLWDSIATRPLPDVR
jgi:hypothetical protein